MTWCHQAPSRYPNYCRFRYICGVSRTQRVKFMYSCHDLQPNTRGIKWAWCPCHKTCCCKRWHFLLAVFHVWLLHVFFSHLSDRHTYFNMTMKGNHLPITFPAWPGFYLYWAFIELSPGICLTMGWLWYMHWLGANQESRFNVKMLSCRCGDRTVTRPSYLCHESLHTWGDGRSLYWSGAQAAGHCLGQWWLGFKMSNHRSSTNWQPSWYKMFLSAYCFSQTGGLSWDCGCPSALATELPLPYDGALRWSPYTSHCLIGNHLLHLVWTKKRIILGYSPDMSRSIFSS